MYARILHRISLGRPLSNGEVILMELRFNGKDSEAQCEMSEVSGMSALYKKMTAKQAHVKSLEPNANTVTVVNNAW